MMSAAAVDLLAQRIWDWTDHTVPWADESEAYKEPTRIIARNVLEELSDLHPAQPSSNEEKLREALEKFGRHTEYCLRTQFPTRTCTCGLNAALREETP